MSTEQTQGQMLEFYKTNNHMVVLVLVVLQSVTASSSGSGTKCHFLHRQEQQRTENREQNNKVGS